MPSSAFSSRKLRSPAIRDKKQQDCSLGAVFPTLVFIDPDENTNTTGDWLDGDHKKTREGRDNGVYTKAHIMMKRT